MEARPNLRKLGGCKPKPAEFRFHASYRKNDQAGCWLWQGASQSNFGYGAIKVDGRKVPAHRYSWTIHNGEIPKGMYVLHKCDVPKCVNPEHLFLGTLKDNMQDCKAKGRTNGGTKTPLRGEENAMSKLTEHKVIAIREDSRSQRKIAADYGITQTLVWAIKNRKTWRHI